MRLRPNIFICLACLLALSSCQWFSSIVHDEEVVAKLGRHRLYRSEVEAVIPKGTHGEDSLNMALLYIDSWATNMAFQDVADKELSKEEKDVTKELEQYKESLLRYRYEQRYVNERLDTTVTEAQIQEYYDSHKESFQVERALVKARFLNIRKDSKVLGKLRKLISSDDPADAAAADSLASNATLHYHDFSSKWIDIVALAAEFKVPYSDLLPCRKGATIELNEGEDNVSIAYLVDVVKAGESAPLEYVRDKVKDSILSERKHQLLTTLEQDLLEEAKSKEKFEIYSE